MKLVSAKVVTYVPSQNNTNNTLPKKKKEKKDKGRGEDWHKIYMCYFLYKYENLEIITTHSIEIP